MFFGPVKSVFIHLTNLLWILSRKVEYCLYKMRETSVWAASLTCNRGISKVGNTPCFCCIFSTVCTGPHFLKVNKSSSCKSLASLFLHINFCESWYPFFHRNFLSRANPSYFITFWSLTEASHIYTFVPSSLYYPQHASVKRGIQ